jgi:NAD(P)-dependent dehydrogenase (short-subunit alcohol dehydrogenase family)
MARPETDKLDTVNLQTLQQTFAVNTFGPLLLTQALLPNILASHANPPLIAVMSSRVGSIADNSSGGGYAYRASKAAVNAEFKNIAVDLKEKGVMVSMLHPGFVRTALAGPPWHKESVEPEEAAGKLWGWLKGKGLDDSGKFWHREGMELPW